MVVGERKIKANLKLKLRLSLKIYKQYKTLKSTVPVNFLAAAK